MSETPAIPAAPPVVLSAAAAQFLISEGFRPIAIAAGVEPWWANDGGALPADEVFKRLAERRTKDRARMERLEKVTPKQFWQQPGFWGMVASLTGGLAATGGSMILDLSALPPGVQHSLAPIGGLITVLAPTVYGYAHQRATLEAAQAAELAKRDPETRQRADDQGTP